MQATYKAPLFAGWLFMLSACAGQNDALIDVVQPMDHRLSCEQIDYALQHNQSEMEAFLAEHEGLSLDRVIHNVSLGYIDENKGTLARYAARAQHLKDIAHTKQCDQQQEAAIATPPAPASYPQVQPAPHAPVYYYPAPQPYMPQQPYYYQPPMQPQPMPAQPQPTHYYTPPKPISYHYEQIEPAAPSSPVEDESYSEAHLYESAYLFSQ